MAKALQETSERLLQVTPTRCRVIVAGTLVHRPQCHVLRQAPCRHLKQALPIRRDRLAAGFAEQAHLMALRARE